MKKIFLISLVVLFSCKNEPVIETNTPTITDSLLSKSKSTVVASDSIQHVAEKSIGKAFTKIRLERISLTKQLNTVKSRVDTVYIETKKSFWGKTKTTTTTKSSSSEIQDSTIKVVSDTLQQ